MQACVRPGVQVVGRQTCARTRHAGFGEWCAACAKMAGSGREGRCARGRVDGRTGQPAGARLEEGERDLTIAVLVETHKDVQEAGTMGLDRVQHDIENIH